MFPDRTPLTLYVCLLLLAGCSSGGDTKPAPAPAAPPAAPPTSPPPPPPPAPAGPPCPSPITADCAIEARHDVLVFNEFGMVGGRQSDYRLLVWGGDAGGSWVNLSGGEYRFSGGTEIAGTSLVVWDTLESDVEILHDYTGLGFIGESELWLLGTVRGDVLNDERLNLRCASGIHDCSSVPQQRIDGNYTQRPLGLLEVTLGRHLQVTGKATLDGLLRLSGGDARYVLPTAPSDVLVLHADGGVEGRFARWTQGSGLFLEGSLRYTANEVYFDATRISLQASMTASGIHNPLVASSAANLDRALAGADGLVRQPPPSLGPAQHQFLASAASLMWMQDRAQATRALESLAGHAHATLSDRLHGQAASATARTDARLSALAWSARPVAWAGPAMHASAGNSFAGVSGGIDQWLSPRLLVGASIGDGLASLHFDALGGQALGRSPATSVHAHYRGAGWHATGLAGAQQSTLQLQRPIELGAAGLHRAYSQRVLDQAFAHAAIGRDWRLGGGTLTPFAAVDYTTLRGDGFSEAGATGFELVGAPLRQALLSGSVGARYAHRWDTRLPVRLDLSAVHRSALRESGPPQRAAFSGVPDLWFDLPGIGQDGDGELRLGLAGTLGRRWDWSMDYARGFGGEAADEAFQFGLQRGF